MIKYEFRVELYFSTRFSGHGWTLCTKEFTLKEELVEWYTKWTKTEYDEDVENWLREQEGSGNILDQRNPQCFEINTTETQILLNK
jgi:hypothetical protein